MGFVEFFLDAFMILTPPAPFVPQYIKMKREGNPEGFSKLVSLIILTCNTLRLCFRMGKEFSNTLVIQSIILIASQLFLLKETVNLQRLTRKPAVIAAPEEYWITWERAKKDFWDWNNYRYYLQTYGLFTVACVTITLLFKNIPGYVEFLGTVSLGIESMLTVPQFLKNRRLRSTEGVSIWLIGCWFGGDAVKIVYFFVSASPVQFVLCGIFQLLVDAATFYQFFKYKKNGSSAAAGKDIEMDSPSTLVPPKIVIN